MQRRQRIGNSECGCCGVVHRCRSRLAAITIQVDYTYDTGEFLRQRQPAGRDGRRSGESGLEAAASYFSTILTDTFSADSDSGAVS